MRLTKYLAVIPTAALLAVSVSIPAAFAQSTGAATAEGVAVDLNGSLAGIALIDANSTIGSVSSPPTSSDTAASLSSAGGTGTTSAGVVTTSATTTSTDNEGTAQITGLNYALLGEPLLDGNGNIISATANCPTGGQPTATTNTAGLEVLGSSVNLSPNTSVTESSAVTSLPPVVGLTSLTENATASNVEQTTGSTALATAVLVTVTLDATVAGTTTTIPVGTITLAHVTCDSAAATPAVAAPTAAASASPAAASSSHASTTKAASTLTPRVATPTKATMPTPAPGTVVSSATTASPSPAAGTLVSGATTVHTGEPWAGSLPYVIGALLAGLALVATGALARRRVRSSLG
jgi:hypothetical protein